MATLADLFKKESSTLYGVTGTAIIDSKGLVNPPRTAALVASSPNSIADLVGNQVGGVVKGSANRPSDTIFRDNKIFRKPLILTPFNSVDADTTYFIKDNPAPQSIFSKLKQGSSDIKSIAGNAAIKAIKKIGSGKKELNSYADAMKGSASDTQLAAGWAKDKLGNINTTSTSIKASEHAPIYKSYSNQQTKREEWGVAGYEKENTIKRWDAVNDDINGKLDLTEAEEKSIQNSAYSYMSIKILGENRTVYFNGAISDISETFQPEWNAYSYLGSPFKVHTYAGIERELSFTYKMYFTNPTERVVMLNKLNYLTSLVYPAKQLSEVTYANAATHQIAFAPNFIILNIKSFYKNLFGFATTFTVTIDETTAWTNYMGNDTEAYVDTYATPSVINIAFGMKIINSKNNLGLDTGKKNQFNYNFRNNPEVIIDTKDKAEEKSKLKTPIVEVEALTSNFSNKMTARGQTTLVHSNLA